MNFPAHPFPVAALPKLIREAVQEAQFNLAISPELAFMAALTSVSTAVQTARRVKSPHTGKVVPTSVFLLIAAASGDRKTTADNHFSSAIHEFEQERATIYAQEIASYVPTLAIWKSKLKVFSRAIEKNALKGESTLMWEQQLIDHHAHKPSKPKKVKLLYGKTTSEALLHGLVEYYPHAAIISDEAAGILNGRTVQDFSTFNSIWSGSPIKINRMDEEHTLNNAHMTFSLMVQPGVLQTFLDKRGAEARDLGFLGRFLVASPESRQGTRLIEDRPLSWQYIHPFHERIREILLAHVPFGSMVPMKVIDFSPEAEACWINIYNQAENMLGLGGYYADIKDFGAKYSENLSRVAALFHYFEGNEDDISLKSLQSAIAVCGWYGCEFKRIFGLPPEIPIEERLAMMLEKWLHERDRRSYRKTELLQLGPRPLRTVANLDQAIQWLVKENRIFTNIFNKQIHIELNMANALRPSISMWDRN